MKKKIKFYFKHSILVIIAAILLFQAMRLTANKGSEAKYHDFFTEAKENRLDILFMGSSHVIDGINPVQLYEDYGFTSYNMGGHGSIIPATYWELVNALDYCTPECVVVDTFMLEKNYKYVDVMNGTEDQDTINASVDQLHLNMDCFPLSKNKLAALNDLISDQNLRNQFIIPFIKYHDRWSSLTENDFKSLTGNGGYNTLMGAELQFNVNKRVQTYPLLSPDERMEDETVAQEYLKKIIDLCISKNIRIILMQVPFSADPDYQLAGNSAQTIADEYGIPYINMMYVADIINPKTDLNDNGHLNSRGSYKTTDYLGSVLQSLNCFTDHRNDSRYQIWDTRVEQYHDSLLDAASDRTDLYSELMLLQYDDISSVVFINHNSNAFYDDTLKDMIVTLAGTQGIKAVSPQHRSFCLIRDTAWGNSYETVGDVPITNVETSFGLVNYVSPEENYCLLSIGDDLTDNVLQYTDNPNVDAQVFVFDNRTGEKISHLFFNDNGLMVN